MKEAISEVVRKAFVQQFGEGYHLYRSPGRVNIIGEHTDYNNGFVLPAAIDRSIYIAIHQRNDDIIRLVAAEFGETHESRVGEVVPSEKGWPNYVLGVVDQLNKRGFSISGFDAAVGGDVPIGAGLSSSAALECATTFALNDLNKLGIDKMDLAFIAQKAEHEFAGVLCGIMDQFASVFGREGYVIKLDCQDMHYEYVPLRLEGYKIVLLNTNVKHSLASSEYNTRRSQCEEGVRLVKAHDPEVESLRDISLEQLGRYVKPVDEVIYRRCRYVVEENLRLLQGCDDLMKGNLPSLGQRMFQSHQGLSKEYEVSCKELDYLVDAVRDSRDVLGARMMGGGFGGCTINLIKEEAIAELTSSIQESYFRDMKLPLDVIIVQTGNGSDEYQTSAH